MIAISKDMRAFFSIQENNTIEFWDCPNEKLYLHAAVNKEIRKFNLVPLYTSKEL